MESRPLTLEVQSIPHCLPFGMLITGLHLFQFFLANQHCFYLKGLNYPSPESSIYTHYNPLLQKELWMQWDSQIPMGRTEPKRGKRTSGRRGLKLQGCRWNEKSYLEMVSTERQCKPVVKNVIAGVVPKSWLFSPQLFVQCGKWAHSTSLPRLPWGSC